MKKLLLKIAPLFILMVVLFSCNDDFQDALILEEELQVTENREPITTYFQISLTDNPTELEEVNIDLQGVIIYGTEGTDSIELGTAVGIYNLLDYQNGIDTLIAGATIELDTIKQVRLVLGENNTVKAGGEIFDLKIPSKKGLRLKMCAPLADFDTYILELDFDAEKSVHKTGQGYIMKPVIKVLNPEIEVEEEDEDDEDDDDDNEEGDNGNSNGNGGQNGNANGNGDNGNSNGNGGQNGNANGNGDNGNSNGNGGQNGNANGNGDNGNSNGNGGQNGNANGNGDNGNSNGNGDNGNSNGNAGNGMNDNDDDKEDDDDDKEEEDDDKEDDDKEDDDDKEEDDGENSTITISDNLQAYINNNYPDFSVKKASIDTLCDETSAIVIALQKMSKKIDVYFDEEERFLHEAEDIKKKDIPEEVIEIVTNTFEEYQLKTNAIKYIKQDGTIQYSLTLFKENSSKEVIVNSDGTIICGP